MYYGRNLSFLVSLALMASCLPSPKRPNLSGGAGVQEEGTIVMADHMGTDRPENPGEAKMFADSILEPTDSPDCVGKPMEGARNLRLLTQDEFYNSLKDILNIKTDFRGSLPPENRVNGFRNNVDKGRISVEHKTAFLEVAIKAADEIKPNLQALVGCMEDAGEACALKVIEKIAPKLYRRPLRDAEKAASLALYKKTATSPREGMSSLIASLIVSPHFLYRSEVGDSTGKLTPYELASALSYFFWGTTPDDQLTALAASGKISEEATLLAETDRLWKDPRSRYVTNEFIRGWMQSHNIRGNIKDPKYEMIFTQEIKDAMATEMDDTFDYLMRQPNANFASLFTTDFSIGSPKLAEYYKAQASMDGGISKIRFPGDSRKGLLTLGAVTAQLTTSTETHPIRRGEFVLSHALCFIPPPTPMGLEVKVPPANPNATTRERFAAHSQNVVCSGCHIKMDGIGFGMEDFDALGLYRTMDNGKPIDSTGTLVGIDGKDTKFKGLTEMSASLAVSQQAQRCYALQWYRFAHGRAETMADTCAARDIASKFVKGEVSLSALLVKIITHPSYSKRGQ